MGKPQKTVAYITPEEYLALEEKSLTKHEYLDGVIYDWQGVLPSGMAGGGTAHNIISGNIYTLLRHHLRGSRCQTFMADMRLHVLAASAHFYPDVMVTCSEKDRESDLSKSEPILLVEVLSPSTTEFDHGEKLAQYRKLPSLQEYLLVDSDKMRVEVFRKPASGEWTLAVLNERDTLTLESVHLKTEVATLYEEVEFP
jgi:Uma2 family endonuclease